MRSATKFLLVVLAVSIVRIAWEVVFADAFSRETVSTFLGMIWGALIVWGGATWELRRTPEESRR